MECSKPYLTSFEIDDLKKKKIIFYVLLGPNAPTSLNGRSIKTMNLRKKVSELKDL